MVRHVHADLIHQWAEGAEVECCSSDGVWTKRETPSWFENVVYSIARPKSSRFVLSQYTLARMATQRSTEYFVVAQSNSDVLSIQSNPDFIEWVR